MIKDQLQIILDEKWLGIYRFWYLIFKLVIKFWMTDWGYFPASFPFVSYLELKQQFFRLSCDCQKKLLTFVFKNSFTTLICKHNLEFMFLLYYKCAGWCGLRIVDPYLQIGHFSCYEKVLVHSDVTISILILNSYLLMKEQQDILLWICYSWVHRWYQYTLSCSNLTFSIFIH